MPSEIRVDTINNTNGYGTVNITNTGQVMTGITTVNVLSGGVVRLLNTPFIEMAQTITTNYTISTSTNAITGGPIGVATGYTVTVPTGSVWIVV